MEVDDIAYERSAKGRTKKTPDLCGCQGLRMREEEGNYFRKEIKERPEGKR